MRLPTFLPLCSIVADGNGIGGTHHVPVVGCEGGGAEGRADTGRPWRGGRYGHGKEGRSTEAGADNLNSYW